MNKENNKLINMLSDLSEGNPGGLSVLIELVRDPIGYCYLKWLEVHNIKGPKIWVAYKDMFNHDIGKLMVWMDGQMKNPAKVYEILQYDGKCTKCKKKAYVAAIVPDFKEYLCYRCRNEMDG